MKKRLVCTLNPTITCACAILMLALSTGTYATQARIKISNGSNKAVFTQGAAGTYFLPCGINHTLVKDGFSHTLFTPQYYDSAALDTVLDEIANYGYNCIRVIHCAYNGNNGTPEGIGGLASNNGPLSNAYMNNFKAFMQKCHDRDIYIIHTYEGVPFTAYYNTFDSTYPDDPNFESYNGGWGERSTLEKKKALAREVAKWIMNNAYDLRSTIFIHALSNEIRATSDAAPFSYTNGSVTALNGNTYNMANNSQRQACFDESMRYYGDYIGDAIKSQDPDTLVAIGTIAYPGNAFVNTSGNGAVAQPNNMKGDSYGNHIHFVRPKAMMAGSENGYDIIDLHVYPSPTNFTSHLNASEADEVNLDNGKIMMLCEIGAQDQAGKFDTWNTSHIATLFHNKRHNTFLNTYGVQGTLWWAFSEFGDNHKTFKAKEARHEILSKLSPLQRIPMNNPQFEDDFDDGNSNGWSKTGSGWTVANQAFEQNQHNSTYSATLNSSNYYKHETRADIALTRNSGWAGVHLHKTNATHTPFQSGYTVFLSFDGKVKIYKAGTGVVASKATGFELFYRQNTLKAETNGNKIKAWVNGDLMLNYTDAANTYPSGGYALVTSGTKARFDNVQIRTF